MIKNKAFNNFALNNQDVLAALILIVSVFLTYYVVISNTFGVLDDWVFLHDALTKQNQTLPLLIGAGRPLNAFLINKGFQAVANIEGLAKLRFITVIGILLLGLFLYKFARLQQIDYVTSFLIGIGIIFLPSFQVYVSWAQHFTTPYAGLLALFSAFILTPACRMRDRSRAIAVILSAILLFTSLLIYQPIGMLYWTGVFISFVATLDVNDKLDKKIFVRIFDILASFSIALASSFVVFKYGQSLYPSDASRYNLVANYYEKVAWFISELLANAGALHALESRRIVQWVSLIVVLLVLLFLGKVRGLYFVTKLIFLVLAAVFLSSVPNLATGENWASYRSIGAVAACVYVSVLIIVRFLVIHIGEGQIFNNFKDTGLTFFSYFIFLFCLCLALHVQSSVIKGFVMPNVIELNNLAAFLRVQDFTTSHEHIILVKSSSWSDSSSKVLLYDEFGMHSSVRDYYSMSIVQTAIRNLGYCPDAKVRLYSGDAMLKNDNPDIKSIIVDFSRLVASEKFQSIGQEMENLNTDRVFPSNISDLNWTAGIWTNTETPGYYSFTYKRRYGDIGLKAGDYLKFERSGLRKIIKVDVNLTYCNILVDGAPLLIGDGFPHSVFIHTKE